MMTTVAGAASRPTVRPDPALDDRSGTPAAPLPLWRLYVMRAGYLYLALGLAVTKWPAFVQRDQPLPLMDGVVDAMLVALSVLFLLGVRYPVTMLPVLLFEVAWKVTWLAAVALPLWASDRLTPAFGTMAATLFWVAPIVLVIPWRYVLGQLVRARGDRWR
jgi:hypothetical protein